jgi:Raf kinase inhibitor-like YbhB/YbcL family protein
VPGCSDDSDEAAQQPATDVPATLTVTSSAFEEGGVIPEQYTCDGAGDVPPLEWTGQVGEADSLAVVVDDPDAPSGTFVHWIVLDLPPGTTSLGEELPSGAVEAENSAGDTGWTPPCPPSGTHHYRFTVYALRSPTGLEAGVGIDEALTAIDDAALARGRLTGLVSG